MVKSSSDKLSTETDYTQLQGKLIFCVDDDITQLQLLRGIVESQGGRLVGTTSPSTMLNLLRINKPDLLIVDVVMPEMDGWQLFGEVRLISLNAETPTIFLTSLCNEYEEKLFTKGDGNCLVLSKPIKRDRLMTAVRSLLHRH